MAAPHQMSFLKLRCPLKDDKEPPLIDLYRVSLPPIPEGQGRLLPDNERALKLNVLRYPILIAMLIMSSGVAFADKLNEAIAYLDSVGVQVPSGYTVRFGGDTTKQAPAEVKPVDPADLSAGGVIVINPVGITKQAPGLSKNPADLGGVLVVVLYHEIKHADGSYSGPCGEIALQVHVAGQHCDFISFIKTNLPGANVSDLCHHYDKVREGFNTGVTSPGGASAKWVAKGCSGPFPGPIPPCPHCP